MKKMRLNDREKDLLLTYLIDNHISFMIMDGRIRFVDFNIGWCFFW
jgi:hypothetical protein